MTTTTTATPTPTNMPTVVVHLYVREDHGVVAYLPCENRAVFWAPDGRRWNLNNEACCWCCGGGAADTAFTYYEKHGHRLLPGVDELPEECSFYFRRKWVVDEGVRVIVPKESVQDGISWVDVAAQRAGVRWV